jgi:hypothetical protein
MNSICESPHPHHSHPAHTTHTHHSHHHPHHFHSHPLCRFNLKPNSAFDTLGTPGTPDKMEAYFADSDSDFTFECEDDFIVDGNNKRKAAELDVEPSAKRRVIDDDDGLVDDDSDDGRFDFPIDDDSDGDFFECYHPTVHLLTDSDDESVEPVERVKPAKTVHDEIASAEKKGQANAAFDALFGPPSGVRRSGRKAEPTRVFALL